MVGTRTTGGGAYIVSLNDYLRLAGGSMSGAITFITGNANIILGTLFSSGLSLIRDSSGLDLLTYISGIISGYTGPIDPSRISDTNDIALNTHNVKCSTVYASKLGTLSVPVTSINDINISSILTSSSVIPGTQIGNSADVYLSPYGVTASTINGVATSSYLTTTSTLNPVKIGDTGNLSLDTHNVICSNLQPSSINSVAIGSYLTTSSTIPASSINDTASLSIPTHNVTCANLQPTTINGTAIASYLTTSSSIPASAINDTANLNLTNHTITCNTTNAQTLSGAINVYTGVSSDWPSTLQSGDIGVKNRLIVKSGMLNNFWGPAVLAPGTHAFDLTSRFPSSTTQSFWLRLNYHSISVGYNVFYIIQNYNSNAFNKIADFTPNTVNLTACNGCGNLTFTNSTGSNVDIYVEFSPMFPSLLF